MTGILSGSPRCPRGDCQRWTVSLLIARDRGRHRAAGPWGGGHRVRSSPPSYNGPPRETRSAQTAAAAAVSAGPVPRRLPSPFIPPHCTTQRQRGRTQLPFTLQERARRFAVIQPQYTIESARCCNSSLSFHPWAKDWVQMSWNMRTGSLLLR